MSRSIFFLLAWFVAVFLSSGCRKESTVAQSQTQGGVNLLSETTFENASYLNTWHKELPLSSSFRLSDSIARKGIFSARFELGKGDPLDNNGKRAELAMPPETEPERWYGFSQYFPASYASDPLPEIVGQWHATPDPGLTGTISPPISIWNENNHLKLVLQWASKLNAINKTIDGKKEFDLGDLPKGQWIDWAFHIKFSWQGDGILEVWKNKQKVVSYYGSNSYNEQILPYFKIGIYKWPWDDAATAKSSPEQNRVVYYDEIRVGDKTADLDAVSPK